MPIPVHVEADDLALLVECIESSCLRDETKQKRADCLAQYYRDLLAEPTASGLLTEGYAAPRPTTPLDALDFLTPANAASAALLADTQSSIARDEDPDRIVYVGGRIEGHATVTWKAGDSPRLRSLPPRLDIVNHSPDGFEWGYMGSGPAQLAFALLLHATGSEARAKDSHQRFKDTVVSWFPRDGWQMTRAEILQHLQTIEEARAA